MSLLPNYTILFSLDLQLKGVVWYGSIFTMETDKTRPLSGNQALVKVSVTVHIAIRHLLSLQDTARTFSTVALATSGPSLEPFMHDFEVEQKKDPWQKMKAAFVFIHLYYDTLKFVQCNQEEDLNTTLHITLKRPHSAGRYGLKSILQWNLKDVRYILSFGLCQNDYYQIALQ